MTTISAFWKGLGGQLARRWLAQNLTPALLFWLGGLAAWGLRHGFSAAESQWLRWSAGEQIAALAAGLILIAASAALVQPLEGPLLGLLEGYWPPRLDVLRRPLAARFSRRLRVADERWQVLKQRGDENLGAAELRELAAIETRQQHIPPDPRLHMPTALGNRLRAAEQRPYEKYGLDVAICWPRLWMLLPRAARADLAAARAGLDLAVRAWLWGLLFLMWTIWSPWAIPVALAVMFFAYRWALSRAEVYGDLLEAAFDLHRTALYQTLRWPLPATPALERPAGEALTHYLWRGSDAESPAFTPPLPTAHAHTHPDVEA